MAVSWAEDQTATLLRVREDGTTWLEQELHYTVQRSIEKQSFSIPANGSFTNGLALTLTGHRCEAEASFQHAREIARAAYTGLRDDGSFGPTLHLSDMSTLLFAIDWLLEGERSIDHLEKAVSYSQETERRIQTCPGLEFGEEGYADRVLLLVLLQRGSEAVTLLPKISRHTYELPDLLKGRATRTKTLALAVRCLCNPTLKEDPKVRERLQKGVASVMRQEFSDCSPDSSSILLWLDLPGSVYGVHEDPWQLLASINDLDGL